MMIAAIALGLAGASAQGHDPLWHARAMWIECDDAALAAPAADGRGA